MRLAARIVLPAAGLLAATALLRGLNDPAARCSGLALTGVVAIVAGWGRPAVMATLTAIVLVITGPVLSNDWAELWQADPSGQGAGVRLLRDGTELELSGTLTDALADAAVGALQSTPTIHTVQLDSPGGNLRAARTIARAIRSGGADTFVGNGCEAACVIAFMAGRQRWIGPFAHIRLTETEAGIRMRDSYRRAGIPAFLLASPSEDRTTDTAIPFNDSVVASGMALPAEIGQFALGGFGPAPTPASVRSRLLDVPLYHALADADPAGFADDLAVWSEAVLNGGPGTAAFTRTRDRVNAVFRSRLASAPPALLHSHALLMAEELRLADHRGLAGCLDLVTVALPGEDAEEVDLALRRAELKTQVIMTPATHAAPETEPVVWPDGLDPDAIAKTLQEGELNGTACRALLGLYEALLSLPENQSTPVMRALLQRFQIPHPIAATSGP